MSSFAIIPKSKDIKQTQVFGKKLRDLYDASDIKNDTFSIYNDNISDYGIYNSINSIVHC